VDANSVVIAGIPTGSMMMYGATTAPIGWVRLNGRTIGNASSGATERAGALTNSHSVGVAVCAPGHHHSPTSVGHESDTKVAGREERTLVGKVDDARTGAVTHTESAAVTLELPAEAWDQN
jgi:cytochrome c553